MLEAARTARDPTEQHVRPAADRTYSYAGLAFGVALTEFADR